MQNLETNNLFNILASPITRDNLELVSEGGNKYLKDKNNKFQIKDDVPILISDKNYVEKDILFKNSIQNFWNSGWNKRSKENDHDFLYTLTRDEFFNRIKKMYENERSRGIDIGGYLSNELKMENLKDKISLIIGPGCGQEAIMVNLLTKSKVIGVDITFNSAFLTNKLFKNLDRNSGLGIQGDSRFLPIKSNSIDFVFSHGVIHHSPNISQSINEIHRVLKPKGFFCVGLYNKHGLLWIKFILNALLKGNWSLKKLDKYVSSQTEKAWITEDNTNPYTKLFSKSECEQMFKLFNNVKVRSGDFKTPNNLLLKFLKLFENSKFLSKFGSMNYISGTKI